MRQLLSRLGLGTRELRAWAMYDWANSAVQTTIIAAVFPIYYQKVAAAGLSETTAMSRFAWATTIAIFIVAIVAPLLGAVADYTAAKKKFLAAFMLIGSTACLGMFSIERGDWLLALTLFVVANVGVAASIVFYDALLPHLVGEGDLDRVSSAGYAMGYCGGGVLLAINLVMIQQPAWFGISDTGTATRLTFATVGVWWVFFSMPLLRRVAEPRARIEPDEKPGDSALLTGARRLRETFHELRRYRQAFLMLLAFLLYNDGIQTMIRMATIYGTAIGLPESAMITALLMTQFIGIPFAFAFGSVAGRIGAKTAIFCGLGIYTLISLLGYYMSTPLHFYALAFLVGMVQGGTQALSRSLFASMVPRHKSSEFFAFFGVFERYAGVLGPAIFAFVVDRSGSGRSAILAVALFFIIGAAILTFVDVESGRRTAREAEAELSTPS
jgi:UMF1 family MFS transporter